MQSLGFLYISSCHLQTDNLTSSFLILISFIFLAYFLWDLSTILNTSGQSAHPYLVSVLRGKAFNFSALRMMLAVGLCRWPLLCWSMCIPTLFAEIFFLSWKDFEFCQIYAFSASIEMIIWVFFLYSVNVVYHINWFSCVEPSLHINWESVSSSSAV